MYYRLVNTRDFTLRSSVNSPEKNSISSIDELIWLANTGWRPESRRPDFELVL